MLNIADVVVHRVDGEAVALGSVIEGTTIIVALRYYG